MCSEENQFNNLTQMDLEDARTKADELGEMAKSSERRAKDLEAQNAGKDFLSAISVQVMI